MNTSLLIVLVAGFAMIIGISCYFIGKNKSNAPVRAGLMGAVFSIIPVLGIIYLVYLICKDDLTV